MSVFDHPDFDDHQQVVFCRDADSGLRAIIAIHNSNLGPALGGCRMWPYPSEAEALRDVLRLSRGMTYKSAITGLPLGGGKSVILGDPHKDKSEALLRAMGRFVDSLGGRYIAAEDSGTSVADLKIMALETEHIAGVLQKQAAEGGTRSGDPSPATAYGVFVGLRAALSHRTGSDKLDNVKVAIQGVGSVGYRLAGLLKEAGAKIWVTDVWPQAVQRAVNDLGATAVTAEQIYDLDVDVFSPCAMGAVLDDQTIPRLCADIVAGAANNQLAAARHGQALRERGILYAPDYVINAGGIVDCAVERSGEDRETLLRQVEGINDTLLEIFARADREQRPTNEIADHIAEERFLKTK